MSGSFYAAGGLGRSTLYVNEVPDGNGHNWFFYFDINSESWKFWYGGIPQPGDNVFGQIVSEYSPKWIGQCLFLREYFKWIGNEYFKDSTRGTQSQRGTIASSPSMVSIYSETRYSNTLMRLIKIPRIQVLSYVIKYGPLGLVENDL